MHSERVGAIGTAILSVTTGKTLERTKAKHQRELEDRKGELQTQLEGRKLQLQAGLEERKSALQIDLESKKLDLQKDASYRDTLLLLLPFVSKAQKKPTDRLMIDDLSPSRLRSFLEYLEKERGCSGATRNLRLAAIHSLAKFIGMRREARRKIPVRDRRQKGASRRRLPDQSIRMIDATWRLLRISSE